MTTAAKDQIRCIGCGKPVEPGQAACQILFGRMGEGEFEEERPYGILHRPCFNRTIESPDSVMDEIRRLSRNGKSLRA